MNCFGVAPVANVFFLQCSNDAKFAMVRKITTVAIICLVFSKACLLIGISISVITVTNTCHCHMVPEHFQVHLQTIMGSGNISLLTRKLFKQYLRKSVI